MILTNNPNIDKILIPGKEFIKQTKKIIQKGTEEVLTDFAEANSIKEGLTKTIIRAEGINSEDIQNTAKKLGEPLGKITSGLVENIENGENNNFSKYILQIAKKYKLDPETVVNIYLKNTVENGINYIVKSKENIENEIVKEVVKNKINKTVKKFSIINYLKNIFLKIKAFVLNICKKS